MTGAYHISEDRINEISALLGWHHARHRKHAREGADSDCGCSAFQDVITKLPEYHGDDRRNTAIPEHVDVYVLHDGTVLDGEGSSWRTYRTDP
jgi:hypothetical protein